MDTSNPTEAYRRATATDASIMARASATSQTRTASTKTRHGLWRLSRYGLAVTTGALFAVMLSRRYGQTTDVSWTTLIIVALLPIGVVTFVLGLLGSPLHIGLLVPIGIFAGVVANATFDWRVSRLDHDLLPIEIIVITLFALPGTIAGLWLAQLLREARPPSDPCSQLNR